MLNIPYWGAGVQPWTLGSGHKEFACSQERDRGHKVLSVLWIRIRIKVLSWIRIRINLQKKRQNVWNMSILEYFFKILNLYLIFRLEARIRIRIKVKGRIRIRIRVISRIWIRNTGQNHLVSRHVASCLIIFMTPKFFLPQDIADKKLEVFCVYSSFHIAQMQVSLMESFSRFTRGNP